MTAALITVFYPTSAVAENVKNIARQTDLVYICDNSPADNGALFRDAAENIRYIWFGENLGISAAFNRVLKDSQIPWQPEDFVFFFDQDSSPEGGHCDTLRQTWLALRDAGIPVGCLGPAYFDSSSGRIEGAETGEPLMDGVKGVSEIITSSMLSTHGTLASVGFWNEDVFLDMADWDLCWRLTAVGFRCCRTNNVILQHSIGSGKKEIGFLQLKVGQPVREYYQLRECLQLLWKSYTPLKYRIRFLAMVFVRSPLHLLFLENRKERAVYIGKGILDYIRGKRGALDAQEKTAASPHT